MNKLDLAKLLGLRLKYDYVDEDTVAEEIREYTSLGADVEFIFDSEDARYDDAFTFEVTTRKDLNDAWEQASEKVLDGLRSSIIMGLKLNK